MSESKERVMQKWLDVQLIGSGWAVLVMCTVQDAKLGEYDDVYDTGSDRYKTKEEAEIEMRQLAEETGYVIGKPEPLVAATSYEKRIAVLTLKALRYEGSQLSSHSSVEEYLLAIGATAFEARFCNLAGYWSNDQMDLCLEALQVPDFETMRSKSSNATTHDEFYNWWCKTVDELQVPQYVDIPAATEFGMWLTTRDKVIKVGASEPVYAMTEALQEFEALTAKTPLAPKPDTVQAADDGATGD